MANQNTVTYNLQDNVSAGLNLMQQQAAKTATALQHIGAALGNLSGAETAINLFIKQQQGLATVIEANTNLLSHENTELSKFDKAITTAGTAAGKTGTDHFKKVATGQDEMNKGFGKLGDTVSTKFRTALDQANTITAKANDLYGASSTLIGDLSGGISSFSDVITIAKDATNVWTTVQGLFNAVMDANPLGAAIALIELLVKAVSYAWDKSEGFREVIIGLWEVIKPFGKVIYEVLVLPFKLVGDALQSVFYAVKAVWDALTGHFSKAGDDLKKAVYYGFEAPVKDMKETVTGAIKETKEAIDSAPKNFNTGVKEGDASYIADHLEAASGLNTGLNNVKKQMSGTVPKVNLSDDATGIKTTPAYTTEPKKTIITNNIQNLIKEFTINTSNLKESVANAKQMVAQALVEAVNDFTIKSGAAI